MNSKDRFKFVTLPDGSLIERDVLGIVQSISERYGQRVRIQYLDPNQIAGISDAPYRILEYVQETDTVPAHYEVLFSVWQLDQRVLDQLALMDTHKNFSILAEMDKEYEREQRRIQKEADDQFEEALELSKAAFRTDKTFTFKDDQGNLVKLTG